MRSSKMPNRLFIALQCSAFAVLILWGAFGTLYQNAWAVMGQGAAPGFCIPGKTAGFAGLSRGGDQDIPRRNSAGRQTIALYMNGTLSPGAPCPGILPASRNIKGLPDFDQIGSGDIFRKICATGKMAVLHSPSLIHEGRDPDSVSAPPQVAVKCGHRSSDGSHHINWGRTSTSAFTCPLFSRGAHCPLVFSSLYIRAPPMPKIHS